MMAVLIMELSSLDPSLFAPSFCVKSSSSDGMRNYLPKVANSWNSCLFCPTRRTHSVLLFVAFKREREKKKRIISLHSQQKRDKTTPHILLII